MGVNHSSYAVRRIVIQRPCTTKLPRSPIAKVLHDNFGIKDEAA